MNNLNINFTPSRPRFSTEISFTKEDIHKRFKKLLQENKIIFQGIVNKDHIIVRLRKDRKKYWHPQVILRVEKENNKTYLKGLFGPHPNIWTFFMFLYALGVSLIVFPGMYGIVELFLGKKSSFLWFNIIGASILLITYLVSKIGQEYSKEHTINLIRLIKKALKD